MNPPGDSGRRGIAAQFVGDKARGNHDGQLPIEVGHVLGQIQSGAAGSSAITFPSACGAAIDEGETATLVFTRQGSWAPVTLGVDGSDFPTPKTRRKSLLRFLAEAVFWPWSFAAKPDAPSGGPLTNTCALATLTVGRTAVLMEVRFAQGAQVASVCTASRWGQCGVKYLQVQWEGHLRDYASHGDVFSPWYGEVGWGRATGSNWSGKGVLPGRTREESTTRSCVTLHQLSPHARRCSMKL